MLITWHSKWFQNNIFTVQCYADCCCTQCHYAGSHYAECHFTQLKFFAKCRILLSFNTECKYAECRYADCRYAECRYAECRYAGYIFFYPNANLYDLP